MRRHGWHKWRHCELKWQQRHGRRRRPGEGLCPALLRCLLELELLSSCFCQRGARGLWASLLLYSCCTVVPSFALSERKKTENRLLAAALKEEAQAVAALHALEQQAQLHAKQALTEEVR